MANVDNVFINFFNVFLNIFISTFITCMDKTMVMVGHRIYARRQHIQNTSRLSHDPGMRNLETDHSKSSKYRFLYLWLIVI